MTKRKRTKRRRPQQLVPSRRFQTKQLALALGALIAAIVVVAAAAFWLSKATASKPVPPKTYGAVDGIKCGNVEFVSYHIHQHLTLYRNGKQVPLPKNIGIPGGDGAAKCFYYLHVHAIGPGIVHVESPTRRTYFLYQLMDIWRATKDIARPPGDAYVNELEAAAKRGNVTVFVNGHKWTRSYRVVPLTDHENITVEIGKPIIPPKLFTNWNGL
jgi:hypothetical protein